jgi:tRNA(fMet)-specific endonuclease VapC
MNYILDTNLVLIYLRSNELTRRIEADLQLLSNKNNLIVSVVSVGELKAISKKNNWGKRRVQEMINTLSEFLITDIKTNKILDKYADIDAFSQGKLEGQKSNFSSRNMGKNDLWIAATASVLNMTLLTTDQDFQHLQGHFLDLKVINIEDYREQ